MAYSQYRNPPKQIDSSSDYDSFDDKATTPTVSKLPLRKSEQKSVAASASTSTPTPPPPAPTPLPTPMSSTPKPTELKIHLPVDFNGDCTKTKEFVLNCRMYLKINDEIYNDDNKKILFVLSYMRGGTAGPWKEDFYNTAITKNNFGSYKDLMAAIEKAFSPSDEQGDAKSKLKTLQMKGGMTANKYITEFRTAASLSGIKEDAALIEYFMEGIPTPLMEKISMMEKPPTTIKDWQDYALRYDNQYRRTKSIMARLRGNNKSNDKKKFSFNRNTPARYVPCADPNAMDVHCITIDRLSVEQRDKHRRKGLCFECHQFGHCASSHRNGTPTNTFTGTSTGHYERKAPMKGKEAYQKIRTLLAELNEDEKEVAIEEMEDEGF